MRKFKKKKIDRKRLVYTFLFSIFCVFGLTVVYAALSTTLNISGSAAINSGSFGLEISKDDISNWYLCKEDGVFCYDNYAIHGNGKVVSEPSIVGTSINNFNFSVELPGDFIIMKFDVTNNGTIPMKYTESLFSDNFEITSLDGGSPDYDWLENVGFNAEVNNSYGDPMHIGDTICPGDNWGITMVMLIDEEATTVPTDGLLISNINTEFHFEQADMSACQ